MLFIYFEFLLMTYVRAQIRAHRNRCLSFLFTWMALLCLLLLRRVCEVALTIWPNVYQQISEHIVLVQGTEHWAYKNIRIFFSRRLQMRLGKQRWLDWQVSCSINKTFFFSCWCFHYSHIRKSVREKKIHTWICADEFLTFRVCAMIKQWI